MTDQQFNLEDRAITNQMDKDEAVRNFIPGVGMEPASPNGNGFKGVIEYVGKDYFILRSYRTNEPVFIRPFQYHNFIDYTYLSPEEKEDSSNLHPLFQSIADSIFPPKKTNL